MDHHTSQRQRRIHRTAWVLVVAVFLPAGGLGLWVLWNWLVG